MDFSRHVQIFRVCRFSFKLMSKGNILPGWPRTCITMLAIRFGFFAPISCPDFSLSYKFVLRQNLGVGEPISALPLLYAYLGIIRAGSIAFPLRSGHFVPFTESIEFLHTFWCLDRRQKKNPSPSVLRPGLLIENLQKSFSVRFQDGT